MNKLTLAVAALAALPIAAPPVAQEAGETTALQTVHELDPWVVSAGASYRF